MRHYFNTLHVVSLAQRLYRFVSLVPYRLRVLFECNTCYTPFLCEYEYSDRELELLLVRHIAHNLTHQLHYNNGSIYGIALCRKHNPFLTFSWSLKLYNKDVNQTSDTKPTDIYNCDTKNYTNIIMLDDTILQLQVIYYFVQ